ncbi:hypothetical protein BJX63DRAFT_426569 [Aspergillus granulosus]|uniref:O-methyltransferase domain-containing protein n=1 Tax=Aspergillus granulosus TaxID=176169 RepID=A0ABR4GRQ6_9EURO
MRHEETSSGGARSPNLPSQIPSLLQKVASGGYEYLATGEQARLKLLEEARALVYALETPREAIIRHCWSEATSYAALETAVALILFNALGTDDEPKSVVELRRRQHRIRRCRIMKHLAAMGVITETGRDEYSATGFSKVLTVEKYSDAFPLYMFVDPPKCTATNKCWTSRFTMGILALPEFLEKTNYRNPTSATETAFQLGYKTDMGFFGHVQQEPITAKRFNNHMGVYAQGRVRWMDPGFYTVYEQLIAGTNISDEEVLLVDVGGSFGHDLSDFRPQDLPEVVASVRGLHPTIDVRAHDFFTEQPVKGPNIRNLQPSSLHQLPPLALRPLVVSQHAPVSRMPFSLMRILLYPGFMAATRFARILAQSSSGQSWRTECMYDKRIVHTARRGVESLIECELA